MEMYLTAKEVALFLKLSLQTIRRYTMNKEIPFHKINRAVRYKKSENEIWVEKRAAQNSCLEGDLFNDTKNGENQ
jgi:excisionase family DNA binding protein